MLADATVELSEEKQKRLAAQGVDSCDITLGVRPEHIELKQKDGAMVHGTVDVSEMMGSSVYLHMKACGRDTVIIVQTMDLQGPNKVDFSIGSPIAFTFGGNVAHMFSKTTEKNLEQ
jgi:multiple sugar transport system ATP-binding protein